MKEGSLIRVMHDGEDGLPIKVVLASVDVEGTVMGKTGRVIDHDFATDVVDGLGSTSLSIVRLDHLSYGIVIPTVCLKPQ